MKRDTRQNGLRYNFGLSSQDKNKAYLIGSIDKNKLLTTSFYEFRLKNELSPCYWKDKGQHLLPINMSSLKHNIYPVSVSHCQNRSEDDLPKLDPTAKYIYYVDKTINHNGPNTCQGYLNGEDVLSIAPCDDFP